MVWVGRQRQAGNGAGLRSARREAEVACVWVALGQRGVKLIAVRVVGWAQ